MASVVLAATTSDFRWLVLSLPFSLILLVAARYAPTAYRLSPEGLRIERKAGARTIPYRSIRGVDRAPRRLSGITMGGSNGIFGRFGRFWSVRLGSYQLQVTDADRVVWLVTDDGLLGVSPDRPDAFVAGLEARLSR